MKFCILLFNKNRNLLLTFNLFQIIVELMTHIRHIQSVFFIF